ncbi:MAG: sulfatase-like hydrolase/transferase [Prolixibacteraceae bacterium]
MYLSKIGPLALFSVSCLANPAPKDEKPNILWITSEDNSAFLGCYDDNYATTPNLDRLASMGIRYTNAFANAPVCAPSRNTIITGMYSSTLGNENMRSHYPVPSFVHLYPYYLKEAGYYTTNNFKKDYNTVDQPEVWDESGNDAHYRNRKPGQPFFAVFNTLISHESCIFNSIPSAQLRHSPEEAPVPPYHPETEDMKHDWAQYYDKVEDMDKWVGQLLKELEDEGLAENTIVFYYSDHGGVLGRSKRYLYESGLHVPLIVHLPEKYKHLAKEKAGASTDRIVSFVDLAPTLLSIAGIKIPEFMQGKAFLGSQQKGGNNYAYGYRGRMDERIDLSRTVRNKQYRYIRNYMPHKIYGQYIEYLWKAPSMPSWEKEYFAGRLNDTQIRFWETKPVEELYDVQSDPHNVNNLAADPRYKKILEELRDANSAWIISSCDAGFIPEPMLFEISRTSTPYDYAHSSKYDIRKTLETAEMASTNDPKNDEELYKRLSDDDPVIRYWAITGMIISVQSSEKIKTGLKKLLADSFAHNRIAASEALYKLGEKEIALQAIEKEIQCENPMQSVYALNVLEGMGEQPEILSRVSEKLKDCQIEYTTNIIKRISQNQK